MLPKLMSWSLSLITLLTALTTPAFAEGHYEANHCELFIDRLSLWYGSHAIKTLVINLKNANPRLDGEIVEVGFRSPTYSGEWKNQHAQRISNDYFRFEITLGGGDYGQYSTTIGSFYLRTSKNTYYWLHPDHNTRSDFIFDKSTYDDLILEGMNGHTPDTREGRLVHFNPDRCR
jgi:hypothetical protein